MLQMSDVQAGGATVFTDIGASVWPKKVQMILTIDQPDGWTLQITVLNN